VPTQTATSSKSSKSKSPARQALSTTETKQLKVSLYTNELERHYLDQFLRFSQSLGTFLPPKRFTGLITRSGETSPAIQQGILAVGALYWALQGDFTTNLFISKELDEPHYENALRYHGSAMRTVLEHMQSERPSDKDRSRERSIIGACLLFICFEALQGHRQEASQHIHHGMGIITKMSQEPYITAQSSSLLPSKPTAKSCAGVTDELAEMFERLSHHAWTDALFLHLQQNSHSTPSPQVAYDYPNTAVDYGSIFESEQNFGICEQFDSPEDFHVSSNADRYLPMTVAIL
jgi:hypothetical protein